MLKLLLLLPALALGAEPVDVYFSPRAGAAAAIVRELDAARTSVLVQQYTLTSRTLADALIAAAGRKVRVSVLLDEDQAASKYSKMQVSRLKAAGIQVRLDGRHRIAHNKVAVIDGAVVVGGSFNWSRSADEENAENVTVIRDQKVAARFSAEWTAHAGHSR